jgi:pyridoxal/pyridoxine/pyridoxamine kinase
MAGDNIILFSGYAKLPGGTVAGEVYKVMALVMLIDVLTGNIVEVDCTLSTRLAERFVVGNLKGKNIRNQEKMIQLINDVYQGSAKKAIITALRIISDKYSRFCQEQQKS